MSSSDDSDLKKKMNDSDEEEEYSDNDKYKKEASNKNAEKFQEKEEDAKEEPKQIKPAIKEKNESEEDSDSSEKKKNQIQEKDNKKDNIKDDTKEKKPNNKKSNDDSDSSESSNSSKEKKIEKQKKMQELKAKREKENEEKLRKAIAEKEKKEKEIEEKNEKIAEEKKFEEDKKEEQTKIIPKLINNKNDNPPWRRNDNNFQRNNNNNNNNINNNPYQNQQNSYVKKKGKKYDLNEEKILNNIISENNEIIEEMKNAYPGITKLDCAYILKKLKVNTSSQTLFEIMNRVHRDISTEITLNRENDTDKKILPQIDPYEIIDTFYSNPDHVNMMKFFKIYCYEDKEKLPPYLQESLPSFFYYNKNKERIERRRKLVKYIDGSFNYIPRTCPSKNCEDNNCPYSHNDNENNFHPLYYKTIYMTNLRYNNDSKLIKDAANLLNYGFDNLIPININVELEGIKYKDNILWNLNEPYLTEDGIAHILAGDNNLPSSFEKEISSQIKRQINSYKKFNKMDEKEIIKTIKLDILIGDLEYKDQFEWDIANPDNDPEEFARNVCSDLGLGTEFVVPITHSIREQILEYQKTASSERNNFYYGGNYSRQPNKRIVVDENNYLREIFTDTSEWDPEVKHVNEEEIIKFEKKEERKYRYYQRKK